MLAELFSIVAPVYLCIALGYLWARSGRPFHTDFVADLCMTVGAPCLIFSSVVKLDGGIASLMELALAVALAHLLFALLGFAVLRAFDLPTTTFLGPVVFANTGNMGLPICLFAFGEVGLALGVSYFALTSLIHFTVGQWTWTGVVSFRQILRTPLAYAALFAIVALASEAPVPDWLLRTTGTLGALTIPLMQLTLGVSLGQLTLGRLPRSIGVSLLRIGMGLAVGIGLAELLDLEGIARGVLILDCAMPVAVVNYLFAQRYGRGASEVAGTVVISTLVSLATLPLILAWLL
ncbi:MAG: AEC family transporter [Deltaproteobacteria bacterium]|nr:AEC family transporter [Deltaproteobacteria bacterium]